jgi:hypothetical protein
MACKFVYEEKQNGNMKTTKSTFAFGELSSGRIPSEVPIAREKK